MRRSSPLKLWLPGICLLPGAILLVTGTVRTPTLPPPHRHQWRPFEPPGGVMRLVDARHRLLSHLDPGQIAEIVCLPGMDRDRCRHPEPDCGFAPEGMVVENNGPRVVAFSDGGAGGEFGTLGPGGGFRSLPPAMLSRATHYRAGRKRAGKFAFSARFDDTARAHEPDGAEIPTFDDTPQESLRQWVTLGPQR